MNWFVTTTAAVLLAILGQYLAQHNWASSDHFLGGYFTAFLVNTYLEQAGKL